MPSTDPSGSAGSASEKSADGLTEMLIRGAWPQSGPSTPPAKAGHLRCASSRPSSRRMVAVTYSSASRSLMIASPKTSRVKAKPWPRRLSSLPNVSDTLAPTMKSRASISRFFRIAKPATDCTKPPPHPMLLTPHRSAADRRSSPKYSSMWRPRASAEVKHGITSMSRKS